MPIVRRFSKSPSIANILSFAGNLYKYAFMFFSGKSYILYFEFIVCKAKRDTFLPFYSKRPVRPASVEDLTIATTIAKCVKSACQSIGIMYNETTG